MFSRMQGREDKREYWISAMCTRMWRTQILLHCDYVLFSANSDVASNEIINAVWRELPVGLAGGISEHMATRSFIILFSLTRGINANPYWTLLEIHEESVHIWLMWKSSLVVCSKFWSHFAIKIYNYSDVTLYTTIYWWVALITNWRVNYSRENYLIVLD